MLQVDQNRLVTQTGPATACGRLMRNYWQPAALTDELDDERPVLPVRLLGEDLVLFRLSNGEYGLIGRHCPHRRVDLAFGRLEEKGLRCPFHGWLLNGEGHCLDMPAEPQGDRIRGGIRHLAYRCEERNGIIFAYMGEGEPPAFPQFDCFAAPAEHAFAFKGLLECNWLQALEVGIDPAHASFLHRFFEDEEASANYGKQFRDMTTGGDVLVTKVLREFSCPDLDVKATDYGLRLFALRQLDDKRTHVRVTNLVFPHAIVIPMSQDMIITQWHVPIDDENCWWYAIFTSFDRPIDKGAMKSERAKLYDIPGYKPRLNRRNDWGFSPQEQRMRTYTGMGDDINVHDQWAVESPGAIVDRTDEHLVSSDKAITMYRRLLLQTIAAVENGDSPPFKFPVQEAAKLTGPAALDFIGEAVGWEGQWPELDRSRRQNWV